jgi:hypothetical protein
VEKVVWHVWDDAPKMSEKLGWPAVAHLIEPKELTDAMLFRRGHPPRQLIPYHGVGVSFQWRDDIVYFHSISVVHLQDHVVGFGFLAADAG